MLSIWRLYFPYTTPIVGREFTPCILLRRADNSITCVEVSESNPLDGCLLEYKWSQVQNSDNSHAVCFIHPSEPANLQCTVCERTKVPVANSYHCSVGCFVDAWKYHRALHDRPTSSSNESGTKEDDISGKITSGGSGVSNAAATLTGSASVSASGQSPGLNIRPVTVYSAPVADRSRSGICEFGLSNTYTPTPHDVGHVLKFECVVVDMNTRTPVGPVSVLWTSPVIPAPSPTPRRVIQVNDVTRHSSSDGQSAPLQNFTVLSYNILSDVRATSESYSYCPAWALPWSYRRQNLLREIIAYHADIICLQEVQNDHFEDFFAPELEKLGYVAVYKKNTTEVQTGTLLPVDGCATFFCKHRFALVEKYEIEYSKSAMSLADSLILTDKNKILSRFLKDNVALIVVLEEKPSKSLPGRRPLICVANTHINVRQDLKDVKLWQVHILVQWLEAIANSKDIPIVACGGFNSIPGSAPHEFLAMGKVHPAHPDLFTDPFGLFIPASKLVHQLPLVSAYSSLARMLGVGVNLEGQRRRMGPMTNEPLFTTYTMWFVGTLDYIFYTADSLTVESLLELLDETSLQNDAALPSQKSSSDHIALRAGFCYMPKVHR